MDPIEPTSLRVLIVDDETVVRESLREWFEEDGHDVQVAADGREALAIFRKHPTDVVLLDIRMPGMDGLEVQRRILEAQPNTTVIIMTAYASVDTAVQALKDGACDYITKPFDPEVLSRLVHEAVNHSPSKLPRSKTAAASEILGRSPGIVRVRELIETVARTETTVLVTGESGTGKELVARAIHAQSPRAYMPLVVVNCGALPEGILESELFGHERGAFTGAQYRHKGKFELADGGSLFLDEIAEISPRIQVELLRVLEEKKVTRLGGTQTVPANFRAIAATNKDLREEVQGGRFREDLFYRLDVLRIAVPPLRERMVDIPLLAQAFVEKISSSMRRSTPRISEAAMASLQSHAWPGNVRELANAVERALVLSKGNVLGPEHFPIAAEHGAAEESPLSLAHAERLHLQRVLRETGWNISRTARILEIDRTTVYNKIKQYDLDKNEATPNP